MADVLEFVGTEFRSVPPGTGALRITILSTFPTIANAGVKLFKDAGDGDVAQVGAGVTIDTSISTPQGPSALFELDGPGNYALAFQGQATAITPGGVEVAFEVQGDTGAPVEDFGGSRTSANGTALINGTAFVQVP